MKTLKIRGKKINMTQVFDVEGNVVPVTLVNASDFDFGTDIKDKKLSVTGISKGKGFTGVIKRWHFAKQHVTRGSSNKIRTGGAIGAQTPGRVFKGKKMAGRKGGKRITVKGLKIVDLKQADKLILVSGAIPGARNSPVILNVEL